MKVFSVQCWSVYPAEECRVSLSRKLPLTDCCMKYYYPHAGGDIRQSFPFVWQFHTIYWYEPGTGDYQYMNKNIEINGYVFLLAITIPRPARVPCPLPPAAQLTSALVLTFISIRKHSLKVHFDNPTKCNSAQHCIKLPYLTFCTFTL